jgi:Na+-translocating ferredoxin:NAD+ oxidoreductase RnfD subunit
MIPFRAPSLKAQLVFFLLFFAGFLAVSDRNFFFPLVLFLCVATAVAAETLLGFWKEKKVTFALSAVITGLILGFVLAGDTSLWKLVFASVVAIASKFVLRYKGKHIFNPAAFGVLFAVLVLGVSTQWRGTYLWQVLVPVGLYLAHRARRGEVLAGYGAVSLVLFGVQALLQGAPLAGIFGYLSYFFIFIMLIEPKTTPHKPIGKAVFGAGVAALIFILTQMGIRFDAEITALLVLNGFVSFLNR